MQYPPTGQTPTSRAKSPRRISKKSGPTTKASQKLSRTLRTRSGGKSTMKNRPTLPPRPTAELYEFPIKHLKSGGGGGTLDGMEQRVRSLETDMSYIKGKLEDMPT